MNNYIDKIFEWLKTNKAELIINSSHDITPPASRIFNATVTCKKFKNPQTLGTLLATEIFDASQLADIYSTLNNLSHDEIDKLSISNCEADAPEIYYTATERFNVFIRRYILCTFSDDRKQIYMYKKYVDDRLISLHKLDDNLEDFFKHLRLDRRLSEFQESFVKEFNEDYEFFKQFCAHKLDSAGKQITDANGNPMLIRPDVDKFISDIVPRVDFEISPFPEVLSNDRNVAGFSNIYFDDLLSKKIGRIDTITEWLHSRFRPDQIDIIEKVIARSLIAYAPDLHGLYIYDPDGENGKSTLLNALQHGYQKLNIKCCNMTLSGIDDKHSYVQYFGASVAFNADVKSPNFIQTDLYHHVTGGDAVTIDPKGGTPFLANVKVTPILAGNIPIQFDTQKNHMTRRIFFIQMHKPDEEYMNKHIVIIKGQRCWKNQHSFAQAIENEITDWMVYCFKKHYSYNLLENTIVASDEIKEEMQSICGQNSLIEENIILKALNQHFYFTANMNDYITTEDLYGMFMDGTISLRQVKVENTWGKSAIKRAIVSQLQEIDPKLDENEIFKRVRIKNRRVFIFCGIKLKNATTCYNEVTLPSTQFKHTQNDLQKIAEEMDVGCDFAHINDARVTTDAPGCEDAEF
ncbi:MULTISPECIES: hypothetical protein [Bacteria]|uniref:hypothetical protein n=1 Tax=Bacteria TaxID=2 RepID=UPI000A4525AD|nr:MULTISPECIES: hypothetical protein [Bacteria]